MTSVADLLISADSHVIESPDLWAKALPATLRAQAPRYVRENISVGHPGGHDPNLRISEMDQDGVSAEVLYPSLLLDQFAIADPGLQAACFRVYNDWLADYCAVAPTRLYGIAALSAYDIGGAIEELHRCRDLGLRGVMVWQAPPERLSFATDHYERLWAAAQEAHMPVSLHILTGMPYPAGFGGKGPHPPREFLDLAVNQKLLHAMNALRDIIGSGVLERFPSLSFVFVENEVSWMPFVLSQYDKYLSRPQYDRYRGRADGAAPMKPSDYFRRQIFSTFFDDPPSNLLWPGWGEDNCMWSNDFPHLNSTWPHSRDVIRRDLAGVSADTRAKLISGNVIRLYGLDGEAIAAAQTPATPERQGTGRG